jgi:hypothetical protein
MIGLLVRVGARVRLSIGSRVAEGMIVGMDVAEGTIVCEGNTATGVVTVVQAARKNVTVTKASTVLFIVMFNRCVMIVY